ncbi:hypothetical protein [Devosia sp. 2618]|uniref:hypothetical protein n=1 Tax=Devosia sp. 2618 TaxID=3156454 RepID=UPI0033985E86
MAVSLDVIDPWLVGFLLLEKQTGSAVDVISTAIFSRCPNSPIVQRPTVAHRYLIEEMTLAYA